MDFKTGNSNTINKLYGGDLFRHKMNRKITSSEIRVCIPAKIISINYDEMTCNCQPLIKEKLKDEQDVKFDVELPILLDVPIVYPSSLNYVITFPLSIDDEVLVVFADMCIDSWWQSGGIQSQFEERRHDLSDGFAIPAQMSQAKKLENVSATNLEIKHRDSGGEIIVSEDKVTIDGVDVAQLKEDFDNLVIAYNSHTHDGSVTGVEPGAGTVGFTTEAP